MFRYKLERFTLKTDGPSAEASLTYVSVRSFRHLRLSARAYCTLVSKDNGNIPQVLALTGFFWAILCISDCRHW